MAYRVYVSGIPEADFTVDLAKTSTFEFNNIMLKCPVLFAAEVLGE